jgi:tyrosinase
VQVELQINLSLDDKARFVTWAPAPCRIRVSDPSGAAGPNVNVKLSSVSAASAGAVRFATAATATPANTLTLAVPTGGASVNFVVAGRPGRPSSNPGDVKIEARVGGTLVGSVDVMVRIRKNANNLTAGERDRFLSALATLNNQGMGRFADFRDMHTAASSPQAHGAPGFLPWHRAYLLDLERELQAIDPSVTLPYWRFDQAAPELFKPEFIGRADATGAVQFSASNPLRFWRTDNQTGIDREPFFNTATAAAFVLSENDTLALGDEYAEFLDMEGDPHGNAHVSFNGPINSVPTAARDPLFFLLHCNVDRLWAHWQIQNGRFDKADPDSYTGDPGNPIGHNLADTMWPWNGVTGAPRPPTAPGGALADSFCVVAPGPTPKVEDCLDYRGAINPPSCMGFDYDTV